MRARRCEAVDASPRPLARQVFRVGLAPEEEVKRIDGTSSPLLPSSTYTRLQSLQGEYEYKVDDLGRRYAEDVSSLQHCSRRMREELPGCDLQDWGIFHLLVFLMGTRWRRRCASSWVFQKEYADDPVECESGCARSPFLYGKTLLLIAQSGTLPSAPMKSRRSSKRR